MRSHCREQRRRHPEDHRVGVDEEETQDDRLAADVTEAGGDRAQAWPIGIVPGHQGRQECDGRNRRRVGDCVTEVDPLEVDVLDQEPSNRGPADGAELRRDAVQRGRCHEVRLVDELRRHRTLRPDADAEGRRDQELEREQRPDPRVRDRSIRGEAEAPADHADLLHEHQPAAVDRVGNRPADYRQRQQRDEVREGDQPDRERRSRELVDLVREHDLGDLRADEGDALPEPEPAEGRIAAQRRQIQGQPRCDRFEGWTLRRDERWLVRQKSLDSSGLEVASRRRRERVDLVGPCVLAEPEEDHAGRFGHARIIASRRTLCATLYEPERCSRSAAIRRSTSQETVWAAAFEDGTQATADASTSTTRSWSSASIGVKNGRAIVRAAVSSATGHRPSPNPKRSRMYGWRWMHGTYSAVATPSRRNASMTTVRSSSAFSFTT